MIAKREVWDYPEATKIWVGKYRHSHNLLHWHYDCELLYVESGSIDIFCERKTHTLTSGEALFVDRGQMHYMSAKEEDTTLIVIIFDHEILRGYMGNVRLVSPRLTHSYPIPAVYADVRDLLLKNQPFCGAEAAAKIMMLMASVFRNEEIQPRKEEDETTRRFMALLDRVSETYGYFTFSDAAAFMNMSEGYFSRYFHGATGITFSKYLNYVRTEHAIELMQTSDLNMTEIADRSGFETIRNFNRVFRSVTGYAPRDLPAGYRLRDDFAYPTAASFNPTLQDCELLESVSPRRQ